MTGWSKARLRASLTLHQRRYSWRRGQLDRARRRARAGGDGRRPGVITRAEAQEIRRLEAIVAEEKKVIAARRAELAQRFDVKPRMITAASLGLRFQYVWGGKGPIVAAAGHYSAGPRAADEAELRVEMRRDHEYHAGKGWGGLSYEYMIADDGTLGLGNPTDRKSAAVALHNTGLINVCCPATTGDRPTAAQMATLRWLLANAHTSALPRAHRSPVDLRKITLRGHKQFPDQSTDCPGQFLNLYTSRGDER